MNVSDDHRSSVPRTDRATQRTEATLDRSKQTTGWSEPDDDAGAVQTLTVAGHQFELIARCPVGGRWVAWVRRTSSGNATQRFIRPILDDGRATESVADFASGLHSTGTTAAAALDRLSERIDVAVSAATRSDPLS